MAYGYIAKLSENVERRHVRFNNRFGIAIAADLYTSKELDVSQKYPRPTAFKTKSRQAECSKAHRDLAQP